MNLKKKFIYLVLIFSILIPFCTNYCFAVEENKLNIYSEAAIIVENSTGKILYQKNAKEKRYPASTTKVMTALLTLENCKLSDIATVSADAIILPSGYANANLQVGEELSIENLLYALLVKSANEAATVLAEHIAGSVDKFADMMNQRAKELGCENTHFVNPNGIHNENHYTTAYDLYLIAQEAMKNETFRKIVTTTSYTLPATNKYPEANRSFPNTNDLIRVNKSNRADNYYYKDAIGIKTGYTKEAKNCLISASNRDGLEFISVVLGAGTTESGLSERYIDTINLFNYGYDNYSKKIIKEKGNTIETIEIKNGTKETKNLNLVLKDNIEAFVKNDFKIENINPTITLNDNLVAPIITDDTVGTISYSIDGIEYKSDLLAGSTVYAKTDISIYLVVAGLAILLFAIILMPKKKHSKHSRNKH